MLHDFIVGLPDGYETQVGERGLQLLRDSGRESPSREPFSSSRTLLVLDEATSALDGEAEQGLVEALSDTMRGCTTLILSHRLSLVSMAEHVARPRPGENSRGRLGSGASHQGRDVSKTVCFRGDGEIVNLADAGCRRDWRGPGGREVVPCGSNNLGSRWRSSKKAKAGASMSARACPRVPASYSRASSSRCPTKSSSLVHRSTWSIGARCPAAAPEHQETSLLVWRALSMLPARRGVRARRPRRRRAVSRVQPIEEVTRSTTVTANARMPLSHRCFRAGRHRGEVLPPTCRSAAYACPDGAFRDQGNDASDHRRGVRQWVGVVGPARKRSSRRHGDGRRGCGVRDRI